MFPQVEGQIPYLSLYYLDELERLMVSEFRIFLMQTMESAGRHLAHLARVRFLESAPKEKKVVVLAGTGAKGGAAMVCARYLSNWGAQVSLLTTKEDEAFRGLCAHQLSTLRRMSLPIGISSLSETERFSLVIDGLLGSSLQGSPQGSAGALIQWANKQETPILSLETPSGLTIKGWVFEPLIKAAATLALGLPKEGLRGKDCVGELYLADIGVPPVVYEWLDLPSVRHLFAQSDIVRLSP